MGHRVGDTIAGVQHDTGCTTRGVQGQDSLNCDVEGGRVEGFEHDLRHLFTIGLRVERCFGKEDGVLFRGDTEFVVESVMPDLLHVIPVRDDTVLNRVLKGEDTTL